MSNDDSFDELSRLSAENYTLRSAIKGPDGFETWQKAAVAERMGRVIAEIKVNKLRALLVTLIGTDDKETLIHQRGIFSEYGPKRYIPIIDAILEYIDEKD